MRTIFKHICDMIMKDSIIYFRSVVQVMPSVSMDGDEFYLHARRDSEVTRKAFKEAAERFSIMLDRDFMLDDENFCFVKVLTRQVDDDRFVLILKNRDSERT